jgi:hypothetical protein
MWRQIFLQRDRYNKNSKLRCIYSVCTFIAVAEYHKIFKLLADCVWFCFSAVINL